MSYCEFPWTKEEIIEYYDKKKQYPPLKILKKGSNILQEDLIEKILNPIEEKRLLLEEILLHPWLVNLSK